MKKDGAKSLETEKNDKIIIPNCFSLPRKRHCEKKAERFFHKKSKRLELLQSVSRIQTNKESDKIGSEKNHQSAIKMPIVAKH